MKKKVIIIYVILILIVIKLPATFFINEGFIAEYNEGIFNEKSVKKLFFLNVVESYIAHYNYGNVLYKQNKFDEAIKEYQKALKRNPPKDKECSIRINLALAMLEKIDINGDKQDIIKVLKEARNVLCENGCANAHDNLGHSETAEQLKSDIDKMLEELQNDDTQEDENQDENEDEKDEEKDKNANKDKVQEQLEKIQKESRKERQEELDYIKSTADLEYYSGKRW